MWTLPEETLPALWAWELIWPPATPRCPTCHAQPARQTGTSQKSISLHFIASVNLITVEWGGKKMIQILYGKHHLWLDRMLAGFETTSEYHREKRRGHRKTQIRWTIIPTLSGKTPSVVPNHDASCKTAAHLKKRCSMTPPKGQDCHQGQIPQA